MDSNNNNKDDNKNTYAESFCTMCFRPESACGKLINMGPNMRVCPDCIQRTIDKFNNSDSLKLGLFPGLDGMGFDDIFGLGKAPEKAENTGGNGTEVTDEKKEEKEQPKQSFPSFFNLGSIFPGMDGAGPKLKKKSAEPTPFTMDGIPAPHKIKESLDEYVIGQEQAKKAMAVAVYNHYKRVSDNSMGKPADGVEIEKSNMLMIGPTGSGKTYLVKTLANLLQVPLAITDATTLTEAGYIGDDVESVLSKLLTAADNDVEKAERGIVFIDEIDKIAKKKNAHARDVSGESVQQGLLKLLEGAQIEVPVGSTSKNAMVPMTTIDTSNILFICGGAFPDLDQIIKQRLTKTSLMGFGSDLRDKYDEDKNLISKVTTEDLREYGMIPEFLGRLPIVFTLEGLTKEMLSQILLEPKNAILKQYKKLLAMDEVKLEFTDEALTAIAEKAIEKGTGARALRAILEDFMLDVMYEIPKDDNIGMVTIDRDYIEGHGAPKITMRGAM